MAGSWIPQARFICGLREGKLCRQENFRFYPFREVFSRHLRQHDGVRGYLLTQLNRRRRPALRQGPIGMQQ